MKKAISLILTVCLLCTVLPFGTFSAGAEELGESPVVSIEIVQVQPIEEHKNICSIVNGVEYYYPPKFSYKLYREDGTCENGYWWGYDTDDYTHNLQKTYAVIEGDKAYFTVSYGEVSATAVCDVIPTPDFEYFLEDGKAVIDACYLQGEDAETVIIPDEIDGYSVVGVSGLYPAAESIENLVLPDSVEFIDAWGFYSLEKLTLGKNLYYFGEIFCESETLMMVTVPFDNPYFTEVDGVVYSKDKTTLALYPLGQGNEYEVPTFVENIDLLKKHWAYENVTAKFSEGHSVYTTVDGVTYNKDMTVLKEVSPDKSGTFTIPDSVEKIDEGAFTASALDKVIFGENVEAFAYSFVYSAVSEVVLPEGLTHVDEGAFSKSLLEKINLPESLVSIGFEAFEGTNVSDVTLPEGLEEICDSAFSATAVEEIIIPDSVYYMGEGAFANCFNLKTVKIGGGLSEIANSAFESTGVEKVSIPSNISSIGKYAFAYSALSAVELCNGIEQIGEGAFNYTELDKIALPDTLKELGDYAFASCENLSEIEFGNGIDYISAGCFSSCKGLKEVTIPQRIRRIETDAFYNCKNLKTVVLHDDIEEIGEWAFAYAPITDVNLGSVTKVASYAFFGSNLSSIDISDNVEEIGASAFYGNQNLSDISVADSVKRVKNDAFDNTSWYNSAAEGEVYLDHIFYQYKGDVAEGTRVDVKDGTTVIADNAFTMGGWGYVTDYVYWESRPFSEITLPDSLETIGDYAFFGCDTLTSMYIPQNVSYIGNQAFLGCPALVKISVNTNNKYFCDVGGVLYTKDMSELVWCPDINKESFIVPESVEYIHQNAFIHSGVKEITIMNEEIVLAPYALGFGLRSIEKVICYENSTAHEYAVENLIGTELLPAKNGWIYQNGGWVYYVDGEKQKNCWIADSEGWCYLGEDGYCLTNTWMADSIGWCYLDQNGRMVINQWLYDGGWYFLDNNGYMMSNCWKADSNGWCYLGESGKMLTNCWQQDSAGWCFLGNDGYCVTNTWKADSLGWCYLDENGRMAVNKWVLDSNGWCFVGADGYCVTSTWKADSIGWCYLNENGNMVVNDWVWSAGFWYYMDGSGYMITGWRVIGGVKYFFNSDGTLA